MKRCARCKNTLPLDRFGRRRRSADGLNSYCKKCATALTLEYRARTGNRGDGRARAAAREWLWAEKSNPCERCGGTFHPVAMQFDHLPGFKKVFEVGVSSRSKGIQALKAERAKCQLLCANCHAIIGHHRRRPGHKECVSDMGCEPEAWETVPIG